MLMGACLGATGAKGQTPRPGLMGASQRVPIELPRFDLQGSDEAFRQVMGEIVGWHVERHGVNTYNVWLQAADGAAWLIGIGQRDLTPMFEVFTLDIRSLPELLDQWRQWKPAPLPEGLPEGLRQIMTTKPAPPAAPTDFEPWPFTAWRTEVARRAEFIVEDADVGRTFGDNPNMQSAARPGAVPGEASAFSEVAAGLLFTGEGGRRLLLAVDWLPLNMLVSEDAAQIETFLADCELIGLEAYLQQRT